MKLSQREIVLIPYPFSNLEKKKVRPALVISNNFFNNKSNDCLLAPLTSVLKDEPYSVLIEQNNLNSGKLIKPSRIRLDKLFVIEKSKIIFKIGILNEQTFDKVKDEFYSLI
ncbi:MAG: type II toxin-antitoxin system PemK/MazF family toxin [Nanoarchaeota archaeon]